MKSNRFKAIKRKATMLYLSVMTVVSAFYMGAFQTSAAAGAPAGVETAALDKMVEVVFWVVRIAIIAAGGIPAVIKIVQGQTDENPRDRNAGIAALVITGAVFGATFAIKGLIV